VLKPATIWGANKPKKTWLLVNLDHPWNNKYPLVIWNSFETWPIEIDDKPDDLPSYKMGIFQFTNREKHPGSGQGDMDITLDTQTKMSEVSPILTQYNPSTITSLTVPAIKKTCSTNYTLTSGLNPPTIHNSETRRERLTPNQGAQRELQTPGRSSATRHTSWKAMMVPQIQNAKLLQKCWWTFGLMLIITY
jgi:hypothetical protein